MNHIKLKPEDVSREPPCIRCHRPAYEHCYSDAGRREVSISGLCEECFDEICDAMEAED
ncbi:hypothetical protein SELR_pSRC400800 (plasmid) [Selenomonas ruminantium subsp. lactilytica TAM6421]|uniref:Uncharacterized protein n=1 Tax=Selenomonas ruminantium subsp. lactilytica (strain NBRC 103574 / TAM6421) TaxID=927704 RepID=I0GVE4_SELRL|nr:hypothetical protein SELR_pSRC400800 [Selenomonas ruminantium subsp. lactilytica TAM6421]